MRTQYHNSAEINSAIQIDLKDSPLEWLLNYMGTLALLYASTNMILTCIHVLTCSTYPCHYMLSYMDLNPLDFMLRCSCSYGKYTHVCSVMFLSESITQFN